MWLDGRCLAPKGQLLVIIRKLPSDFVCVQRIHLQPMLDILLCTILSACVETNKNDMKSCLSSIFRTALHWSSKRGYENIVSCLLEHGADRDVKNKDGVIACDVASSDRIRIMLGGKKL